MNRIGGNGNADQGVLNLQQRYTNRGLFADNFLKTRLLEIPDWQHSAGIDAAFDAIQRLYNTKALSLKGCNEAQTEDEFIKPILDILWQEQHSRDTYQVQVAIPNTGGLRPDYAFFRSATDRIAAMPYRGTLDYWRDVPCLGDAKCWSDSLDKNRDGENPSAQIVNYLYRTGVRWGILTNGRIWRLYEREKSRVGSVYFEVNLEEILQHCDRQGFRWFFLFFRRMAFIQAGEKHPFIVQVFDGSEEYATKVGERLKESVYEAMRLLMNGLFEYPGNHLEHNNPVHVKHVHQNSLIVLYRLLFLLYAEDRNLLPKSQEPYASYCLYRIQHDIKDHLRNKHSYPTTVSRIWGELTSLFNLIDTGPTDSGIPAYNGGLFSPEKHPFIAYRSVNGTPQWEIGDHRLAEVIDMLSYQREQWNSPGIKDKDIDYKSLAVQHLGSIYEGLLELKPQLASEALIEVLEDGKQVYKPVREAAETRRIRGQIAHRIAEGEIYLITDRGERKASGSYYTPTYIVDYMVQYTVGVLVDEAAQQVKVLHPAVTSTIERYQRTRAERITQYGKSSNEVAQIDQAIAAEKRRLLEPYLSLHILDPAMGSGHFLVGAADFISLAMATDPYLPALEVSNGEDPQTYYKRLVVEHCLYGVDLNPLAVELAKLSLWLHTVSRDKALSFLDHHLRCGNSLIGARIEQNLMKEPPIVTANSRGKRVNATDQQLILGFTEALQSRHLAALLDLLKSIGEIQTFDAVSEHQKQALYAAIEKEREKFRAVANCWIAPYFGIPITPEQYEKAITTLRSADDSWQLLIDEQWFSEAQQVAEVQRFFHWELEFPEIFFEKQGLKISEQQGFDAVIGNPPWEKIAASAKDKKYLQEVFHEVTEGEINFYPLILYHCNFLSKVAGRTGLLVPNTWLINKLDTRLREFLLCNFRIEHLFYLCKGVFPDAPDSIPVMTHLVKQVATNIPDVAEQVIVKVANDTLLGQQSFLSLPAWDDIAKTKYWFERPLHQMSVYDTERNRSFCRQLEDNTIFLGEIAHASDGIYKSTVEKYRVQNKTHQSDLPVIESADQVVRYGLEWAGSFIPQKLWIQHQALHEGEKIVLHAARKPKLERRLVAAYTKDAIFFSNRFILIKMKATKYSSLFTLAVVNSLAMNRYFKIRFPITDVDGYMIHQLPIRRIEFITSEEERMRLLEQAKQISERCLAQHDNEKILDFVVSQLSKTPAQADVIHDLLAHLAEQMISLHEQQFSEINGFLTWLERHVGTKFEGFSNKTKIKDYHEYALDSLFSVLKSNQQKLPAGLNPGTRQFQDDVEREFSTSTAKLTPLKAYMAAIDLLIEQIIFKLYGLTVEIRSEQ